MNHGLLVLDLARSRSYRCWPKETRPLEKRMELWVLDQPNWSQFLVLAKRSVASGDENGGASFRGMYKGWRIALNSKENCGDIQISTTTWTIINDQVLSSVDKVNSYVILYWTYFWRASNVTQNYSYFNSFCHLKIKSHSGSQDSRPWFPAFQISRFPST